MTADFSWGAPEPREYVEEKPVEGIGPLIILPMLGGVDTVDSRFGTLPNQIVATDPLAN